MLAPEPVDSMLPIPMGKPKPVAMYVAFRRPEGLTQRCLCLNDTYGHCELVVLYPKASKDDPDQPLAGHVHYTADLGERLAREPLTESRTKAKRWSWFRLQPRNQHSLEQAAEFLERQRNKCYNYAVFASCLLHVDFGSWPRNSWFCSQLCCEIVQRYCITEHVTPLVSGKTTPTTLAWALLRDSTTNGFKPTNPPTLDANDAV